jgi:DNA-binding SARP family transcriptional activator/WD40 repeat protein
MRIAVLGSLEVRSDALAPVPVPGAKERLILAVLTAAAPGAVSADRLIETVWNGDPPPTARKSLQAHLVRLRSALEPDRPRGSSGRYIVRRGPGYALALDRSSIDALRIGDLAARGRAELASGQAAEALRSLSGALELWRDEPYADWPDAPFAEAERRRLTEVRAGAVVGVMEARLAQGRPEDVIPELEALVVGEPLQEGWWRLLMLALYRAGRQADALSAGRRARGLLAAELGTDPGPGLREMEAAILAQDPALELVPARAPPVPGTPPPGSCPYKGLAAYQVSDAPLFHGRGRLVARLVARLVDAPLLVVSGPSGAGKSSLVRAGLIPALLSGALPDSATWRPVVLAPGVRPVDALAALTGEDPPDAPVLLVCDQFEQLWAPGTEPAERTAFLDAILGLLDDGVVVRCVLAVRGDHLGRLADHAALTERLGGALVLVPALTDDELHEIVRAPAQTVGLTVEAELLDAVVADVRGRIGALPLLSTALVGTWERRSGHRLTMAGYLQAGGVAGALTTSAETAYAALAHSGREDARRLLVRLADVDDGGALVRRSVPLAELDMEEGGRRAVVETFVDRRLLAVDGDGLEVAHEALLTGWPRLARWLEDDAAGRTVRRHLAPAAREWHDGGCSDDELYRGARLAAALDWAAAEDADPTPVEREFLDASERRAEVELVEARERADREATARRRTRRLAAGLAAVLVLALIATVLAVRSQRQAQRASLVADANRLAALSTTAESLDLSLLLAAQAVRLAETPETLDGLLTALVDRRRAVRAVPFDGRIFDGHLAGNGRTLFLGVGDDLDAWAIGPTSAPRPIYPLSNWTFADASPTEDVLLGGGPGDGVPWLEVVSADGTSRRLLEGDAIDGLPLAGVFSADGGLIRLLVAGPADADPDGSSQWQLVDVDPDDPAPRSTGIGGTIRAPVGGLAAAFSDDAGGLVLWAADGGAPAVLVDLSDGRQTALPVQPDGTGSLGFEALPSGAAQLWSDGTVTRFDEAGAAVQRLDAHQAPVRDVAVSPDGTWAVSVGNDAVVVVWDVDQATGRWTQRELLPGHEGDVMMVEVDPTGQRMYTAALDDTVIAWDMSPDGGVGTTVPALHRVLTNGPEVVEPGELLVAPTGVRSFPPSVPAAGSPSRVAATFFDPSDGRVVDEIPVGDTVPGMTLGASVSVSPDRSMVAVTWGLGVTVRDARTRAPISRTVLPPNGLAGPDGTPLRAGLVLCAAWSPDGGRLLLGVEGSTADGTGGDIAVVDPRTGDVERRVDLPTSARALELSPDGEFFVVASGAGAQVHVLDAATLRVERTVDLGSDDRLVALDFSADGNLLAAGGLFGLVHVLRTDSWRPAVEAARAHEDAVLQVEWLADRRTVASSGMDGTVRLLDVARGRLRSLPLPGSTAPGEGDAHLVPDPHEELVAIGGERPGRRYPMESSVWLDEACAVVGRDLTRAEWDRYLPGRAYAPTCTDRS